MKTLFLSQKEIDDRLRDDGFGDMLSDEDVPDNREHDLENRNRVLRSINTQVALKHQVFARILCVVLREIFHQPININCEKIKLVRFIEYLHDLNNPTMIGKFHSDKLGGDVVVSVDPNLTYMLSRIIAGNKSRYVKKLADQKFGFYEMLANKRLEKMLVKNLNTLWDQDGSLNFKVAGLITNPQLCDLTLPEELVVVCSLVVSMNSCQYDVTIAYPWKTLLALI